MRRMKKALFSAFALGLLCTAAQAQFLPRLGDDGLMPLADEQRIGLEVARSLYQDADYIDDPLLVEHVDGIFYKLLAAAHSNGSVDPGMARFPWRMVQGADTTINAFAVPGGVFGLHLATIGVTEQPDELASVLAHEISHVTQRHIARIYVKQQRMQPLLIGTMLLGAIAASKSGDAGTAIMMGGQGLAAQSQLSFSRDMEREADRSGLLLMQQAGFSPLGFASMFEKLQHANRINDDGRYPYLRSHPLTTERIADMRTRLGTEGLSASRLNTRIDLPHRLLAARARALATPRADSWRTMQEQAQAQLSEAWPQTPVALAERMALLYQGSVAALRRSDGATAERLRMQLSQGWQRHGKLLAQDTAASRQSERLIRLLGVEVAQQQGRWQGLEQRLGAQSSFARPEFFLAVQTQLHTGQEKQAQQALKMWLIEQPNDAGAWLLLAQAHGRLNQGSEMARAQGEAAIAQYDLGRGLAYLQSARRLAEGQLYELSILDARIRQIEQMQREQHG